jgi:hypothetical protein
MIGNGELDGDGAVVSRTRFHGASFITETASETRVCVCPCSFCGHRADVVCRIRIDAGEEYVVVVRAGASRRRAEICAPCWDAIREANATQG